MRITKETKYSVITPKSPTPRETHAAAELLRYLRKIIGAAPIAESDADIRFIIGGPTRNEAARELISKKELDSILTGQEGYLIRVCANDVLIAGSEDKGDDERGTLYGVYELLEYYFGCTLAAYTHPDIEGGEIIPKADAVELPEGDRFKSQSDRPFRMAIVQYGDRAGDHNKKLNVPFFDWLVKNRYNRIFLWSSNYIGYCDMGLIPELEKRGLRLTVGHHESLWLWLPYYGNRYFPEHYVETHPEYYRLNADGKRFLPNEPNDPYGQWIICSRNEELIETVSRNMIEWIKKNPIVDTVTLFPNDGKAEHCCCPLCAPYSKTENYLYFQNEVAKRVSAAIPHAKIDMIIYVDLWECPEGTKLHPSLQICEATWSRVLRSAGKPDGSCLIGTDFDTNIVEWRKTGAQVYYYDYYMGVFGNRQRIVPMADELQSIWRDFIDKDIMGSGTQIECFNLWNHLLNLYSYARTGYDTSLSLKDNINALCKLFGEGAEYVAEAMELMEEVQDGQQSIISAGKYMVENIDLPYLYRLFDDALKVTVGKCERNNLRLLRMALRHSELEAKDPVNTRPGKYVAFREYDDPTGELAYIASNFDSFHRNNPGYGISCTATNSDTKDFVPNIWYDFE